MKNEEQKNVGLRSILDRVMLVAHHNHALAQPLIIAMPELLKLFKKDQAAIITKYLEAVKKGFYDSPSVQTALVAEFRGALPGYVSSPEEKAVIADFFDICEEQLFAAVKNSFDKRNPEITEHYNIGDMLINKKGGHRLIIGLHSYDKKGKRAVNYQYMDEKNQNGQCDHVSMVSWLAK